MSKWTDKYSRYAEKFWADKHRPLTHELEKALVVKQMSQMDCGGAPYFYENDTYVICRTADNTVYKYFKE